MATYNSLTALFTATANAIRAKTGSEETIIADNFPVAIEEIQTGGTASIELTHDEEWRITGVKLIGFTEIPNLLFTNNPYLTTVDLSECPDLLSIGVGTFSGCTALSSVLLPSNLEDIGQECFLGCTSLTSITIPDSTKVIRNYAFKDCTGLTSIKIPAGCNIIGMYAFRGCSGLVNVEIGGNITGLGAFFDCPSVQKAWFRNGCVEITTLNAKTAPFGQSKSDNVQLFCEASEKPEKWGAFWNYCGTGGGAAVEPTWNVSTCPWA